MFQVQVTDYPSPLLQCFKSKSVTDLAEATADPPIDRPAEVIDGPPRAEPPLQAPHEPPAAAAGEEVSSSFKDCGSVGHDVAFRTDLGIQAEWD